MATAIVPFARGRALARVSAANLPPAIASGIFDVLTAFPAGPKLEDADKKRLVRIYCEAVTEFPPAVSECALRWLKLHNPRNPFRPTPQDVYEACKTAMGRWQDRVVAYFASAKPEHSHWPWQDYSHYVKGCGAEWGPPPFTPGCLIPNALVKEFLRQHLGRGLDQTEELAALGRKRLAKIPTDCFMDGQLAAALTIIEREERRQAEMAKHNAYLDTLDPDLRWHRRIVLNMGDNHKLSEDDLIAAARRSLQREQAENARRKIEVEENNRRMVVNAKPEVQAIISNMHAARTRGDEAQHKTLVTDYVAALRKHGAKPPPHLEELNARELDP
jgi:hypothetical protein